MADTTTISQGGINFIVDSAINQYQGWGKKYANSNNKGTTYPADPNDIAFGINAVEIDWNGAKPGIGENSTTGITTTGELLSLIKAIHTKANGSYASSSHTHALTIEKQTSGDAAISLTANTLYKLTAGGSTLLFKTPIDNTGSAADGNTTYKFNINGTWHGDTINGVDLSGGGITIPTIQAGTNISVDNTESITTPGTCIISHATPTGASASEKGSKSGPLLASITTDAQGHVTAYDTIDKTGLRDLIKSYFAPVPPTLTGISVSGEGLESYHVHPNESIKWNTGTVTATYSDGTSKIITGNVEPTLSSSNTDAATISGNKITTVAIGQSTITATYRYAENGVTKELPITKTLNVSAISKELEYISWESIRPVSGNVGDDVDFGYIQMWFKNGETELIPFSNFSSTGISLYTDSTCRTPYNKNTQYTNQPIWASLEGSFKTKYSKKVTLTQPVTLSSISVTGQGLERSTRIVGKTTSWKKGTVTATYSNGTSKDITSSVTPTLSSYDTYIASVSGNTVTANNVGSTKIKATYTYTENDITKTKEFNEVSFTVIAPEAGEIAWENLTEVIGNVGKDVDFGYILVTWKDNTTEKVPYNSQGVELYTDYACTIKYNNKTVYSKQPIYAKYAGEITMSGKPVTLTQSTTYYTYIGTDPSFKLVTSGGDVTSGAANNISSMPGVKTSATKPTSITSAYPSNTEIVGNNDYVYIVAVSSAFNKSNNSKYLKSPTGNDAAMDEIGTFTKDGETYKILSTRGKVSTVLVQ